MRCAFLVTIAALVTTVAACDKDNNGGSSKSPGKWSFNNTVNRDAFELRLNELGALASNADRVALPKAETRASGSLRALNVVETFAGVQTSPQSQPAPSMNDADDCANLVSIFGLQASSSSSDGGSYRLNKGDSCGAAIGSIKSFYSQALDALQVQASSLKKLKAGTVRCGMKIEELPMDGANAALAYRLTAVDAPVGQIFQQDVMGGANAEEVAYNTRLTVGCSDAKSCGETGISQLSIEGSSEAVGNTVKGTLKLANDYAMSFAFGDSDTGAVTTIKSNSTISGLKDNAKLKVEEAAAFAFAADNQEGAASTKIDLTMTVEELEGGRLKLTGSVKSDDEVLGEQTFTTVLSKESGMCRVLGEDEWQGSDPTDPTDPTHPTTPDPAAPVFDAGDLEGTWLSTCDNNSLGRLGYPRYEERLTYGAGGDFTHRLTSFGDNECFPGKEQGKVELTGSFAVTEALERNYDNRWEYGLNYHYTQLKVTLLTDELVTTFNTAAVCNKTDWAKDTAATFDAGACYFDLGGYSLLNMSTLKRKNEFTAFVVEAPTIADFVRTTDFYGDDGELGRARATNSSERKLKKLPE